MNVEDRIAETGGRSVRSGAAADNVIITTYDDDQDIGRAGAFPMNTMDRIKMAEMNATRRSYGSVPAAVRSQAGPTAVSRPDGWRYQRFQNRWWYYGPSGQWSYWQANRWNKFVAPAPAVE